MMAVLFTVLFRWLKKEIGDHTRQDLTHAVTESYHHAKEGFHKGRKAYDRGRDLNDKLRSRRGASDEDADEDGPEGSYTTQPVKGRPPAASPPHDAPPHFARRTKAPHTPAHRPPGHPEAPKPVPRVRRQARRRRPPVKS